MQKGWKDLTNFKVNDVLADASTPLSMTTLEINRYNKTVSIRNVMLSGVEASKNTIVLNVWGKF